jgi:hypothetical protein
MSKLRNLARGRDCQIRIPGVCNGNPETVVLCHLSGGGMGAKVSDLHGAYGCSDCHGVLDGARESNYRRELLDLWHHHGVIRTQEILEQEGVIRV